MQTTHTTVLERRTRIADDHSTLPYEAGWASEAVFFLQTEGEHPELTAAVEVSPDGIHWIRREPVVALARDESVAELTATVFGNWLRLALTGATAAEPARVLVHLNLKG